MRNETLAIHGGYEVDPTTKAVAVPIYQTAAYAFDSADHGAALFNLEVDGFRYSRIANPTTAVLDRRVAALEGGREALSVATGQAATNYAVVNITEMGSNIVSVPQLYGTTHAQEAQFAPVAVELFGMGIASGHHRRPLGDPQNEVIPGSTSEAIASARRASTSLQVDSRKR
jgi:O-acetylhomoserine/O-acetylserine sulfhydrylase-like pyridoxal-dependent enzyme